MKKNRLLERIINKAEWHIVFPLLSKMRRKRLKTTKFTIISNNCWGGRVYEYFNLKKQTPTVGSYLFADDYVKLCKNLKTYLSKKMVLITFEESKHKNDLIEKGEQSAIVGKLDDIEIIFLHYNNPSVVLEKWERRIKRICWENIILKFSYQNNCSDELVKEFLNIKEYKKIFLCGEKCFDSDDIIIYPRHIGKETYNETENFDKFIDVVSLINSKLS